MEVVPALATNSQQKINCGKVRVSHLPKSNAEMIDDQLNSLCDQTGLIKKRVIEAIGLYQQAYLSKMKYTGLNQNEIQNLESWIRAKGKELEKINIEQNPAAAVERLHRDFYFFKGRLLEHINTSWAYLARRNNLSKQQMNNLQKYVLQTSKTLKSFRFNHEYADKN